ncbi:MAG: ABC transporter ATP-binding protein [Clostridia bacterium]|nr:ABC transporter ATP-binding protein [Clostridia bacterium]
MAKKTENKLKIKDKKKANSFVLFAVKKRIPALLGLVLSDAVSSVCAVSTALIAKYVINAAIEKDIDTFKYLIILAGVFIAEIVLHMLSTHLKVVLNGRLVMDYKTRVFSSIFDKDYTIINTYHSGELLNRLSSDVGVVADGISNSVPQLVSFTTRLITAIVIMLSIDKGFVGVLLLVGIICVAISVVFRKPLKTRHKAVQAAQGKLRSFMQESIESMLVVKVFGIKNKINDRSNELQKEHYKKRLRKNYITILASTGLGVFFVAGYATALAWCSVRLYKGELSPGDLTAILQLVNQIQTPLVMIAGIIPAYFNVFASAERLIEIEDVKDEAVKNTDDIDFNNLSDTFKDIRFENVTFRYDRDIVLENADFTVNRGDFIAITGISGIGKSTLFKIMLGVLEPEEGCVYIDADKAYYSDIKTRRLFSYVPQGNMLFSGTIRDNIAFVKSDATDEEIMNAAHLACADEFINELPEGLDTVIGEKGHGLSEGQVQRIAVARALLCNSDIVLLDEATSALDEQTEKSLLENIRGIKGVTCIIISHKAAVLDICNREIRIEDKKIIEKQ